MNYSDFEITLNPNEHFDNQTALSLAICCALTYEDKSKIQSQIENWHYQHNESIIFIAKGRDIDTQCFVMANSTDIVIAFRGSSSLQDWLSNFQAAREPGPLNKTKAHEGFQDALFPAVIKLTNAIDKLRYQQQKIWLTGHSLGGALCSLYAGMLIENNYPVHGIYTFASPRPGNAQFAEQLNDKVQGPHHRVVNKNDIVPHVPPEPFFSHAGTRRILLDNQSKDDADTWWDQRINALNVFVNHVGESFDVIDNHTLFGDDESYIPKLIKLNQKMR